MKKGIIIKPETLKPMKVSGRVNYKYVDPTTVDSDDITFGLCVMEPGGEGRPGQSHSDQEEVLYILSGNGIAVLNDDKEEFKFRPMDVVYIPRGTYHLVKNPNSIPLQLLWIISPPGWCFDKHPEWEQKAKKGEKEDVGA